ncbi:hypothetical protein OUZ56_026419 [Daphnia magna]|uniref:Uncharacterized protein n=1 Tax=Daphnia magna TaxID=35525 RepID=A0ABQ9ZLP0_9CRUS|nr:hypothetical protein OUZ56_026419 [Daphnia magna]
MEASLENATLDESEVGASWEVIEGDAVHSETEDGLNESMDGSTANASHSKSNLSSHSKSKEPKMWYEQQVLTYFEFPKTLKEKKKRRNPRKQKYTKKMFKVWQEVFWPTILNKQLATAPLTAN